MSYRLPNYLYIGPDKSGSTWLFEVLRCHPNCYVPSCKDIYYFDEYYYKGIDWYKSFFEDISTSIIAIGEFSHSYLFSAKAAYRIKKDFPEIKLITTLRNPIERCFSHYLYLVSCGLVNTSFEDAIKNRPGIILSSLYSKPLNVYFDHFDKHQIEVLFFDDLEQDPVHFSTQVYKFLNLEFNNNYDYRMKVKAARRPRNYAVARIVKLCSIAARKMNMAKLVGKIKSSFITKLLYETYNDDQKPIIQSDTKEKLIEYFEQEICELEKMLNVDLTHWRQ